MSYLTYLHGRGGVELKPVTPLAVAGHFAATPAQGTTQGAKVWAITCAVTGMRLSFENYTAAEAKAAVADLAALVTPERWESIARLLLDSKRLSEGDQRIVREVQHVLRSFRAQFILLVNRDDEGQHLVVPDTGELVGKAPRRAPAALYLSAQALAKRAPVAAKQRFELFAAEQPGPEFYALRRALAS